MDRSDILDSASSWQRLLVALLIGLVANAGMWAVVVIMPAVEAEFALTRADTSLPYMLSMLGYGLGNFIIGRWVDRVGIATALTGASFGIAASFFAATQAGNIGVLAAIHFILGLFAAVGFAPLMSDISHWFIKWRGTAMALVASANYLSGAVWPTVLAGVLAQSGWRATYQTLAVITIVVVLPLAVLLRRRVPDSCRWGLGRCNTQQGQHQNVSGAIATLFGVCWGGVLRGDVHAASAHRHLLRWSGIWTRCRRRNAVFDVVWRGFVPHLFWAAFRPSGWR